MLNDIPVNNRFPCHLFTQSNNNLNSRNLYQILISPKYSKSWLLSHQTTKQKYSQQNVNITGNTNNTKIRLLPKFQAVVHYQSINQFIYLHLTKQLCVVISNHRKNNIINLLQEMSIKILKVPSSQQRLILEQTSLYNDSIILAHNGAYNNNEGYGITLNKNVYSQSSLLIQIVRIICKDKVIHVDKVYDMKANQNKGYILNDQELSIIFTDDQGVFLFWKQDVYWSFKRRLQNNLIDFKRFQKQEGKILQEQVHQKQQVQEQVHQKQQVQNMQQNKQQTTNNKKQMQFSAKQAINIQDPQQIVKNERVYKIKQQNIIEPQEIQQNIINSKTKKINRRIIRKYHKSSIKKAYKSVMKSKLSAKRDPQLFIHSVHSQIINFQDKKMISNNSSTKKQFSLIPQVTCFNTCDHKEISNTPVSQNKHFSYSPFSNHNQFQYTPASEDKYFENIQCKMTSKIQYPEPQFPNSAKLAATDISTCKNINQNNKQINENSRDFNRQSQKLIFNQIGIQTLQKQKYEQIDIQEVCIMEQQQIQNSSHSMKSQFPASLKHQQSIKYQIQQFQQQNIINQKMHKNIEQQHNKVKQNQIQIEQKSQYNAQDQIKQQQIILKNDYKNNKVISTYQHNQLSQVTPNSLRFYNVLINCIHNQYIIDVVISRQNKQLQVFLNIFKIIRDNIRQCCNQYQKIKSIKLTETYNNKAYAIKPIKLISNHRDNMILFFTNTPSKINGLFPLYCINISNQQSLQFQPIYYFQKQIEDMCCFPQNHLPQTHYLALHKQEIFVIKKSDQNVVCQTLIQYKTKVSLSLVAIPQKMKSQQIHKEQITTRNKGYYYDYNFSVYSSDGFLRLYDFKNSHQAINKIQCRKKAHRIQFTEKGDHILCFHHHYVQYVPCSAKNNQKSMFKSRMKYSEREDPWNIIGQQQELIVEDSEYSHITTLPTKFQKEQQFLSIAAIQNGKCIIIGSLEPQSIQQHKKIDKSKILSVLKASRLLFLEECCEKIDYLDFESKQGTAVFGIKGNYYGFKLSV